MQRNGKALKTVSGGSPRRIADGKNAFRKMSPDQRAEYLKWLKSEFGVELLTFASFDPETNPRPKIN